MKKVIYWLLFQIDTWGSILSTKITQWTRKSPRPIHPKHLVDLPWHHWYLEYIRPKDVVLDAGCNNTSHTQKISSQAKSVFGFDHNISQLSYARSDLDKISKNNIFLSCANAEFPWPFPDDYFDVVTFLDVLEHLENRAAALFEVWRILKKRGYLLLAVPNRQTAWKIRRSQVGLFSYSDPDHKYEYTLHELEVMLKDSGFRCLRIEPVVYDTWLSGLIDLTGSFSLGLYHRLAQWKRRIAIQNPTESTGFRIVAIKNG